MPTTLELIGAPTDIGASVRGAGMGPDALRVADLPGMLARLGFAVRDSGNLAGPATPWAAPQAGLRHVDEVVAWNRAVYQAVDSALGAGHLPVLLGGDHCLAIGSISAIAWHVRQRRQKLRVIWLDAHTDVNTDSTSPSGNIHGMPVACLLGHGPAALTGWSGEQAAVDPDAIRFLGIRSVDAEEKKAI
ncbi:MAG: arginase family protein, partial [Variovorax sp.]